MKTPLWNFEQFLVLLCNPRTMGSPVYAGRRPPSYRVFGGSSDDMWGAGAYLRYLKYIRSDSRTQVRAVDGDELGELRRPKSFWNE